MSLGERIRHLRQSRGFTQSDLGGAELSKSFISLLEKNRAQPSLDTLLLLARRLGTSVDALLGQGSHVADLVSEGLLSLSREAIRAHDLERAATLLAAANYVSSRYGVAEASRECLIQSAQVAMEQRRFGDALGPLAAAEQACEQAEDLWRYGRCLLLRGMINVRQREIASSIPILKQALAVLRKARASRDPARVEALITLGTALGMRGDYVESIRWFEEALAAQATVHDAILRGKAQWGIGLAYRKAGKPAVAQQHLRAAADAFESAEALWESMEVLKNLGLLLYEQGRFRQALRYLTQALRVMDRLEDPMKVASLATEIARVHLSLGNVEEAEHFTQQALEGAKTLNDPVEVAEVKVLLARIALHRSNPAEAARLYREALATFRARQIRGKMGEVARELGMLLRDQGAHAQAATYLAMALQEEGKEVSAAPE